MEDWLGLHLPSAALADAAEASVARATALAAAAEAAASRERNAPRPGSAPQQQRQRSSMRTPALATMRTPALATRRLTEALTASSRSRSRACAQMGIPFEARLLADEQRSVPNLAALHSLHEENEVLREARSHLKSQLQSAMNQLRDSVRKNEELTEARLHLMSLLRDSATKIDELSVKNLKLQARVTAASTAEAPVSAKMMTKNKIVRKPDMKAPRHKAGANNSGTLVEFDYSGADSNKWVFNTAVFAGASRSVSMGNKERVQGKVSAGVEALKANP